MWRLPTEPWEFLRKAIPGTKVSDFVFGMPATFKSNTRVPSNRFIRGVASTPAKDLQQETVVQKGLDLKYFLQFGYFNNDHQKGFHNKVGQPTKAEIKYVKDRSGKKVLGLWVEGYLWAAGTHKVADAIWELAKAMEASGSDRKLGFSIEGKVLQRDGNKILKAWVKEIAITPGPINTQTWMETVENLGKSWAAAPEIDSCIKSLECDLFKGSAILERLELDEDENDEADKALSVAGGSLLVPESLEGTRRATFEKRKEKDDYVGKSIKFAYIEARKRGYQHDVAQRMALLAAARTFLL